MTPRTPELRRLAAARPALASQTSVLIDVDERQRLLDTITADPSRERSRRRHLKLRRLGMDPSARTRTRLLATMSRHTGISAAVALLTLVVASAAIADAAGVLRLPAFWQQDPAAPSPYGTTATIPSSLASSYAILRRPRQPSTDSLPTSPPVGLNVPGGIGEHYGINLTLSRLAGTVSGVSFWLVPGELGSCMYTTENGSWCTSNALVTTQGLQGLLVPAAGGADTFVGIVPDAATVTATNSDGSEAPVSRSGNAYVVGGDVNLHSVTVHEADGHDYTNAVPLGSPTAGSPTGPPPPSGS